MVLICLAETKPCTATKAYCRILLLFTHTQKLGLSLVDSGLVLQCRESKLFCIKHWRLCFL